MNKTFTTFFPDGVFKEIGCDPTETCNDNEILFKGLVSSWLSFTALLVPSTFDTILPRLKSSAQAAAKSCTGHDNNTCGVQWYQSKYDGWIGMEEEISAANIFISNLVNFDSTAPVTSTTGGNSTSNPDAGENEDKGPGWKEITSADRAGAGILTAIFALGFTGVMGWTLLES